MRKLSTLPAVSLLVASLLLAAACGPAEKEVVGPAPPTDSRRLDFALAIHGGAGVIPRTMEVAQQQEYFDALGEALSLGRDLLAGGARSLSLRLR